MKLHLPKGIRVALCACLCAAVTAPAWADDVEGTDGTENTETVSTTTITLPGSGSYYTSDISGTGNVVVEGSGNLGDNVSSDGLSINNSGTLTFSVTDKVELGAWPTGGSACPTTIGSNVTNIIFASGYTFLTCQSTIQNSGSLTINENAQFGINSGTSVTLNSAITNNGTLTLSGGTMTLADGVIDTLSSAEQSAYADNGNGFNGTTTVYTLVTGTGSISGSAKVYLSESEYATLTSNGTFTVLGDDCDGVYYVNSGTATNPDLLLASSVKVAAGAIAKFDSTSFNTDITLAGAGSTLWLRGASPSSAIDVTLEGGAGVNHLIKGDNTSVRTNVAGTGDLTLEATGSRFLLKGTINNTGAVTVKGDVNVQTDGSAVGSFGSNVTSLKVQTDKKLTIENTSLYLAYTDTEERDWDTDSWTDTEKQGNGTNTWNLLSIGTQAEGYTGQIVIGSSGTYAVIGGNGGDNFTGTRKITGNYLIYGDLYFNRGGAATTSSIDSTGILKVTGDAIFSNSQTWQVTNGGTLEVGSTIGLGHINSADNYYGRLTIAGNASSVTANEIRFYNNKGATNNYVQMDAGTLTLGSGGVTTYDNRAAALILNGGTVKASDENGWAASSNVSVTLGAVTFDNGENTITLNGATTFTGTVTNKGSLALNGALTIADDANLTQEESLSAGANGFSVTTTYLVKGETGSSVSMPVSAALEDEEMQSDGTNIFIRTQDTTYQVNEGEVTGSDITGATAVEVADGATLNLTDTVTLNLESLNLAAGATIALEENTRITITGALTIGEGVIFDVSSWCNYDEFTPYDLFTISGTNASVDLPQFVSIYTMDGLTNEKAFLTYDTAAGTVKLVPEPTTATLSLLALAGLAARRRRK